MSFSDLKRRITSIKNTSKITKAMSLISAAQMNKIKHSLLHYNDYANLIAQIFSSIAFANRNRFDTDLDVIMIPNDIVVTASKHFASLDTHKISDDKNLLIVMTAEKGLCGSFNSAVVNHAMSLADDQTDILCVGKKGYEILIKNTKKKYHILRDHYIELNLKQISSKIVMGQLTKPALNLIASNSYTNVKIIYTEYISMLKQEVMSKQLFPLSIDCKDKDNFECDSAPLTMLSNMIPHYLHSIIYHCVLHSFKSETVKRMMTMDNASTNSKDILHNLNLEYNSVRQAKVTMELIELISGMQ